MCVVGESGQRLPLRDDVAGVKYPTREHTPNFYAWTLHSSTSSGEDGGVATSGGGGGGGEYASEYKYNFKALQTNAEDEAALVADMTHKVYIHMFVFNTSIHAAIVFSYLLVSIYLVLFVPL